MKKLAIITVWTLGLFTSSTFADYAEIMPISANTPMLISSKVLTSEELSLKYDVIIRNNNIESDNEYNSKNYFTSKINTSDIVIPDEIKNNSSKIYFLVEEGSPYMLYKAEAMNDMAWNMDEVKKEYNYRVVNYTAWKTSYTFNNKDLVKDFDKNESKSVNISLVAELNNWEKVYLSNGTYLHIWDKQNVLNNLKNKDELDYFGYYNTQALEDYLEKKAEKMTKADYIKMLTNAQKNIKGLIKQNQTAQEKILNSINKESDFEGNVEKFALNTQTQWLLRNVLQATNSQIQKTRALEVMDNIFNK